MSAWIDPDRTVDLISGFAGSVVTLFVRPPVGRWSAFCIVFTGVTLAYFGTRYLASYLPPGDDVRGVAGLILGSVGFYATGRAIDVIRKGKLPLIGREGRDDI